MNNLNLRPLMMNNEAKEYPLWHPFSGQDRNYFNQLSFEKGEGIYLIDADGRKYIDGCSGLWNMSLGYKNEKIENYVKKQLDKLPYCSLFEHTNSTALLAANKILELLPQSISKLFFTCSGSESIELAIKVMREYWYLKNKKEKNIIIGFNNSYHGSYYGSMGISGILREETKGYNPMLPQMVFYDAPTDTKTEEENARAFECLEQFITEKHEHIAGIVMEPILASGGVKIIPMDYISKIGYMCKKYDIIITTDEVALGFYRTGKAFYFYNFTIEPDIVCMAKGINAGYLPLGAVAFSRKITDAYRDCRAPLVHGSTQGGNLLACAASIAALEEYKRLKAGENALAIGSFIKKGLQESLAEHKNVRGIRGEGLIIAIDMVKDRASCRYLEQKQYALLQQMLAKEGLLIYRSRIGLTLLPMLNTTVEEAGKIVEIISSVVRSFVF